MKEIANLQDLKLYAAEEDFPYSAIIEIITKCNFCCEHCYIPEHTELMEYDTVISIVDQLKDLGVFEISLTGGEVVLHPDFMKIVRYIRNKGIMLELMSNCSIFTDEVIDELAKLSVSVSTTLFSMDSEINDSITSVTDSVDKVLSIVKKMRDKGIKVDIKVPVMKKNLHAYEDIKKFCDKNGVLLSYSVTITPKTDGDSSPMKFAICQEELDEFIEKNDKYSETMIKDYNDEAEEYVCTAIGNSLGIEVDGGVYPCNSFHYKYGNIHENSLKDIWYYLEPRKKLKRIKKSDLQDCVECSLNHVCVRCPGLAYEREKKLYDCSEWDRKLAISRIRSLE